MCTRLGPKWKVFELTWREAESGGKRGQCERPAGEVWDPRMWPFSALK